MAVIQEQAKPALSRGAVAQISGGTAPDICEAPTARLALRDLPSLSPEAMVARWGTTSVSPFVLGPGRRVLVLADGGVAGYVRQGGWAVMATDPVSPPGTAGMALDEVLDRLRQARLKPLFAAVADPEPYVQRGLHARPVAEDAVIDLAGFSLSGKRRASIRHSVSSARRSGLHMAPWSSEFASGAAAVSAAWLATKRGGEMGFTLGRFDTAAMADTDCHLALDGDGRVVGFVTWHHYDDGRGRVLDLMRRLPDAPNPTMDLLVAESLLRFAAEGIQRASLGCVPLSQGRLAERIYPTRSLHRYKDKFAPEWEPRSIIVPSRRRVPAAMVSLAKVYSPAGLLSALRHNG